MVYLILRQCESSLEEAFGDHVNLHPDTKGALQPSLPLKSEDWSHKSILQSFI
jgi:hypothetical protein